MEILKMTNQQLALIIRGKTTEFSVVEDNLLHNTGRLLIYDLTVMRIKDGKLFKTRYLFGSLDGKNGFHPREIELIHHGERYQKTQFDYTRNLDKLDHEDRNNKVQLHSRVSG